MLLRDLASLMECQLMSEVDLEDVFPRLEALVVYCADSYRLHGDSFCSSSVASGPAARVHNPIPDDGPLGVDPDGQTMLVLRPWVTLSRKHSLKHPSSCSTAVRTSLLSLCALKLPEVSKDAPGAASVLSASGYAAGSRCGLVSLAARGLADMIPNSAHVALARHFVDAIQGRESLSGTYAPASSCIPFWLTMHQLSPEAALLVLRAILQSYASPTDQKKNRQKQRGITTANEEGIESDDGQEGSTPPFSPNSPLDLFFGPPQQKSKKRIGGADVLTPESPWHPQADRVKSMVDLVIKKNQNTKEQDFAKLVLKFACHWVSATSRLSASASLQLIAFQTIEAITARGHGHNYDGSSSSGSRSNSSSPRRVHQLTSMVLWTFDQTGPNKCSREVKTCCERIFKSICENMGPSGKQDVTMVIENATLSAKTVCAMYRICIEV